MRKTAVLLMSIIIYTSCNETTDYFLELNQPPKTHIIINNQVDSIGYKDSIKIEGNPILFEIEIEDEENLEPYISYDTTKLEITHNEQYDNYQIRAIGEGKSTVEYQVTDAFNETISYKMELVSFKNLLPECNFEVSKQDQYTIKVDATDSFDRDSKFGGYIEEYEYNLNGYEFTTNRSEIYYTFGTTGNKNIKVRVKDNNEAWSSWKQQYFEI